MIRQDMVLTGFSGANIAGVKDGKIFAAIQAMRTQVDGKIILIFVQVDRNILVNEHRFDPEDDHEKGIQPFDITIVCANDKGDRSEQEIKGVQLTSCDYFPDLKEITSGDLVCGEQYHGTYETFGTLII